MQKSELRLIKNALECLPQEQAWKIPRGVRGIYVLYQKRRKPGRVFDFVYVGMASRSIRTRINRHIKLKGELQSHFSFFEVWDNISNDEIEELEGLCYVSQSGALMDEFIESIEKTNLGLTKFEMIENYHLLQASVVEDVSLLITVVFSFIIATYFVGAKITKSQAIAITALYSVFVWLTLVGILIGLIGVNVTAIGINGSGSIAASFLYPVFFAVAWGYSVFFLYQTRRKERDT